MATPQVLQTLEPDQRVSSRVLKVLLFAALRDRAGWSERQVDLSPGSTTARDVWHQLQLGSLGSVSVAVNRQLVGPDHALKPGDELAFLPPFTGG
ncbi:MAG: MoaD/ThiS family protein [Cyanobacteriota bacterium]|uniref:MoaD/ThiS family protein n=1 Tax=Synechococcus sp. KORDI-100 TaxID=1280380 RepID=UPI0004E04E3D|nr:MoaD/ThiS family protein [Synechococcus sp. KORDI-100]AII41907.1 hypothetical protein KR100_00600 [Synechococcus sp. KORDI-100]MEC8214114.1 MoaD/ThiS family protein [Cyanobacteriota bacterium]MED5384474.1 MoaD/ThiS family protein [Cyanobacteriota bacterium]